MAAGPDGPGFGPRGQGQGLGPAALDQPPSSISARPWEWPTAIARAGPGNESRTGVAEPDVEVASTNPPAPASPERVRRAHIASTEMESPADAGGVAWSPPISM
eukprot:scaffold266382_cov30-Tisochrysis_lutea.AAC.7